MRGAKLVRLSRRVKRFSLIIKNEPFIGAICPWVTRLSIRRGSELNAFALLFPRLVSIVHPHRVEGLSPCTAVPHTQAIAGAMLTLGALLEGSTPPGRYNSHC